MGRNDVRLRGISMVIYFVVGLRSIEFPAQASYIFAGTLLRCNLRYATQCLCLVDKQ
jgi:hypothetical protein